MAIPKMTLASKKVEMNQTAKMTMKRANPIVMVMKLPILTLRTMRAARMQPLMKMRETQKMLMVMEVKTVKITVIKTSMMILMVMMKVRMKITIRVILIKLMIMAKTIRIKM